MSMTRTLNRQGKNHWRPAMDSNSMGWPIEVLHDTDQPAHHSSIRCRATLHSVLQEKVGRARIIDASLKGEDAHPATLDRRTVDLVVGGLRDKLFSLGRLMSGSANAFADDQLVAWQGNEATSVLLGHHVDVGCSLPATYVGSFTAAMFSHWDDVPGAARALQLRSVMASLPSILAYLRLDDSLLAAALGHVVGTGASIDTEADSAPAWCINLRETLKTEGLEAEAEIVASQAVDDACRLLAPYRTISPKRPNISEEGLLSLEWKSDETCLLLIFSGDGDASYSLKCPEALYVTMIDFKTSGRLPKEIANLLVSMSDS